MDPNKVPLYVALTGVELENEEFDLGGGVVLSKTEGRLDFPLLVQLSSPSAAGAEKWVRKNVAFLFDVYVQLLIPTEVRPKAKDYDWVFPIKLFATLFRIRSTPQLIVPIASSVSVADLSSTTEEEYQIWPLEIGERREGVIGGSSRIISEPDLNWIKDNWPKTLKLMIENNGFNAAVQALDHVQALGSPSLRLLILWCALEALFSTSQSEVGFRLSATIASYLKPPGNSRYELQNKIKVLYGKRSKAAHGNFKVTVDDVVKTFKILRQCILNIIEDDHVPTDGELIRIIFGATSP